MKTIRKHPTKPKVPPEEISNMEEYTKLVEFNLANVNGDNDMFCYRGVGDSLYELIPGLFRHPTEKDYGNLLDKEEKMIKKFVELGTPFFPTGTNFSNEKSRDVLDCLFFMQHWGMPTRLLDWTQNPYVALFFALSEAKKKNEKYDLKCDAAVWVLNAVKWNRWVLKSQGYKGGVLSVGDPALDNYVVVDPTLRRAMNMHPIALWGIHNNVRISVQKGMFVIFGKDVLPMEKQIKGKGIRKHDELLYKVLIKNKNIDSIFKNLYSIGFTDSFVYPDLHGLANEMRRDFGFKVEV